MDIPGTPRFPLCTTVLVPKGPPRPLIWAAASRYRIEMLAHSNHGRMNSVFLRIQAYIRTLPWERRRAFPSPWGGARKIERTLSIYKFAGVFQENFHEKDVYEESNRTGAVLLFHFGMRSRLHLPLRAAGAKTEFIYHCSGKFGIISCLPSIQKQTPNPANLTTKEQLL